MIVPRSKHGRPPDHTGLDTFYRKYVTTDGLHILGTRFVSDAAIDKAKDVLSHQIGALLPKYDRNRLQDILVVVISKWDTPSSPAPIYPYTDWTHDQNWLRGGSGGDSLHDVTIVTEEMMCKTGVTARGNTDATTRTLDQVVHEFGHTIERRYGLYSAVDRAYKASRTNDPSPREWFAWRVQAWFDVDQGGYLGGRAGLKAHDPEAYKLLSTIFDPTNNWKPNCAGL
jgi:hypothetical protein